MKKKLAIFDIDGTIFRKNLHFELIDELSWRGIFSRERAKIAGANLRFMAGASRNI